MVVVALEYTAVVKCIPMMIVHMQCTLLSVFETECDSTAETMGLKLKAAFKTVSWNMPMVRDMTCYLLQNKSPT